MTTIYEEPLLALQDTTTRETMQIAWDGDGPALGLHFALKPGIRWVTVTSAVVDDESGQITVTVDGVESTWTRYFPATYRRAL
ncbi:hypothetical protein [Catenuloplanes indicus]|uniref:Uncharacterized protein n=1 Tax=Catenuloplanes indicus TaxID=137267 RepID=A0AAE4B3E2_9ACTN|nr:hypothetical protein [Catenuloplanes indicus]MDQ0363364.1 hypothetical protein [Catenuloplanes indicus]MDQ0371686.1 hypothetical protein [Catenuloplanes indicus]